MREDIKIQNLVNSKEFQELKLIVTESSIQKEKFDIIELFEDYINENALSRIFSFLISSEENHNLGQAFLRGWATRIKNSEFDKFAQNLPVINNSKIKTITEWSTKKNRRIDIVVLIQDLNLRTHSVIGIENKIDSGEGDNQLSDYQDALVEDFPDQNKILFFLTPNGRNSVTSKNDSSCNCIEIDYNTISDTCLEIVNRNKNNQVILLLKSVSQYIIKMNKQSIMSKQIESIISKIYSDKESREAINILINNLPNITTVFAKLEQYYSKNNIFYTSIFHENEFKLHTKKLDEFAKEFGFGICYMLHFDGKSPDIDDFFVLRLMLFLDPKKLGKDKVLKLQKQFKFPNSLNVEKNWWQWTSIWTGDSYKLIDLGERDFEGLKNLLEISINQTYDILEQKILDHKK